MAEKIIGSKTVDVDDEGYMTDPNQWDGEIAKDIASGLGIAELTDDHMKVVDFLRKEHTASGTIPTLRKIGKKSGVNIKSLYKLFPDGPVKKAAMISGLPKPNSCV
ncbi:Sulfite reductase, dissimilatory-type subunit gamma [subsurface metagenome]